MKTPQWHAPPPMPPPQWNPQAHYTEASPYDMSMSPWLLDKGASHHIASDLSNLSLHTSYQGGDDVMIGNGTGLPITHTGSIKLPSSSRSLTLNNVMCVPSMKKNLISVNKLCKTNNVMVQMCPSDFRVKDLRTGETLLNGQASKGVYEWPTESSSSFNNVLAFSCFKTSKSGWHSRLGHPNSQTLNHMISIFHLPVFHCHLHLAILVSVIKHTNFYFQIPLYHLLAHQTFFYLMFGLLPSTLLMVTNIMFCLLTISQGTHGCFQ